MASNNQEKNTMKKLPITKAVVRKAFERAKEANPQFISQAAIIREVETITGRRFGGLADGQKQTVKKYAEGIANEQHMSKTTRKEVRP